MKRVDKIYIEGYISMTDEDYLISEQDFKSVDFANLTVAFFECRPQFDHHRIGMLDFDGADINNQVIVKEHPKFNDVFVTNFNNGSTRFDLCFWTDVEYEYEMYSVCPSITARDVVGGKRKRYRKEIPKDYARKCWTSLINLGFSVKEN